jgi:glycosyltransferase involved in cell wall biosynthesis
VTRVAEVTGRRDVMTSPDLVKLIIQIPCFNEEDTLPATLADLPRAVPGIDVVEWLVIDDGSTDRTAEVARAHGVDHVVRLTANRGLANAFRVGIDTCLRLGADVIVNTDADNQYYGPDIERLVNPILDGGADVVIGDRPIEEVEDFSRSKKLLQRVGSRTVRAFSGTDVQDAVSGFRALDREAALRLQIFSRYTYTIETIVQAGAEGLRVVSVPIRTNPATRPSRLVRSIPSYVWRSLQTIVRSYALYRPFRFFALIGLVPFLVGCALVLRWLLLRVVFDDDASRLPSLVAAAVCLISAVQIWVLAFVADLMAANRRMLAEVRVSVRREELAPDRTTTRTP